LDLGRQVTLLRETGGANTGKEYESTVAEMKRHKAYFLVLLLLVVVYYAMYFSVINYPDVKAFLDSNLGLSPVLAMFWIQVAPWYALICLGCYCLTKLGLDLLTFRDCPQEIPKLAKEIEQARKDLQNRGFKTTK
jgi:dolichyl-phosphate mannosyltransferase polypeptide 3